MNNPFKDKKKPWLTNVMPVYNDEKRVADAIMSVMNQDYPNTELIVVNDGSTDRSRKRILAAQEKMTKEQRARFKFIDLKDNVGACKARNLGAKERHPETKYLTFLPADAFLYPGVVKYWVKELETHTDFDGFYGKYRFIKEGTPFGLQDNEGFNVGGGPFDAYLLETSNYIDGTFPIRVELFDKMAEWNTKHYGEEMGAWDYHIKSLQDYDYWLQAVKIHKAKLLSSPSIFFETDLPHNGGLSADSNANWLERMDQIKAKYGIPVRKLCVMAFGAWFHAIKTAELLNADFSANPNFKPNHYEAFYIMGGYPQFALDVAGALKKYGNDKVYSPAKFIMHWIGSDLLALKEGERKWPRQDYDSYVSWLRDIIDIHLVEAPHTYKELFDLTKIKAKIVPLPSARMFDIMPFPKKPTVAVYQPSGEFNEGLYMSKLVNEVAEKMPDVEFIFYGMSETGKPKKKNIEYRPFDIDPKGVEKLIADTQVLLRLTVHDGLPLSIGEFASAGRHTVTNVPVPEVRLLTGNFDADGVVKALRLSLKQGPNIVGAKYYKDLFDKKKFKKTMDKLVQYDAKDYWEKRAKSWDEQADQVFDKHESRVVKNLVEKQKFESVIDVGCGNGIWSTVLPKDYVGIDIAKTNVEIAKRNFPEKKFEQVALEDAQPVAGKADVAFCHTILMHVTEDKIQKAIKALKGLAKKAIIIEPNKIETGFYQTKHDIPKLFDVELTIPMPKRTLYLVKL